MDVAHCKDLLHLFPRHTAHDLHTSRTTGSGTSNGLCVASNPVRTDQDQADIIETINSIDKYQLVLPRLQATHASDNGSKARLETENAKSLASILGFAAPKPMLLPNCVGYPAPTTIGPYLEVMSQSTLF